MNTLARLIPLVVLAPLHAEQVNLVQKGAEAFQVWGCATCHAIDKDDVSIKSGPSLYDLFQTEPRDREVVQAVVG